MGVAKAANVILTIAGNLGIYVKFQRRQEVGVWSWRVLMAQRKSVSWWTLVCGLMLFGLCLISLLIGYVVSDIDWYSQGMIKHGLKLDGRLHEPIDKWKSKYSKDYNGCSECGRHFARAVQE